MFADQKELAELLATTKDIIADNKWTLSFVRKSWSRVPGGGQVQSAPTNIHPQDVYFGAVTIDARYIVSFEGNTVTADYVIVGLPNLDVAEKDEFTAEGRNFVVVEIHPDHQYETRAWCIDRTTNGGSAVAVTPDPDPPPADWVLYPSDNTFPSDDLFPGG